ncbi:MAG: hypothetical protein H6Q90_4917 [Deltaproteobacteria bacterium]|nr:hypothetical protein [Deltaproteobacteria bacterium]
MELSGKALIHVVEAVKQRLASYDRELAGKALSDDARSDIENDKLFLVALLSDMEAETEGRPKHRRATEPGHA